MTQEQQITDLYSKVQALADEAQRLAGRAFSASYSFGNAQTAMTTAEFVELLASLGAFDQPYWMARGSWSYANNRCISDTGCGNIHLAGCTVEVMGNASTYTIRIHTPTTSANGVTNTEFVYVNNGSGYSPGWRKIWNDKNDGSGSGLDADLFRGSAPSAFVLSNGSSWTPHASSLRDGTKNRFHTDYGYIDFGPMNASTAHIYTNMPSFYFNKDAVYALGNLMWHAGNNPKARGSVSVANGVWTNVSFGVTFSSRPVVSTSTSHATAFPKVRAVTATGCQVCLDGTASGTVDWMAELIA